MNLEGMGDFDEDNIIVGKRRRKAVDYRKLNDSMFGDLSKEGAEKVLGEAGKGAESWSPAVARKRKKEEEEEEGGGRGRKHRKRSRRGLRRRRRGRNYAKFETNLYNPNTS